MANKQSQLSGSEFASKGRQRIITIIVILFASAFIGRLAYLQIIKGNIYRTESETQAIKQDVVEPFRGNMYDRYGRLIVHNEPSFTVRITPSDFKKDRLELLANILGVDTTEIISILEKNRRYTQFEQIRLARDVDFQTVALIEENIDLLPGVDISIESKRLYEFSGNWAHFLGYTREISIKQLDEKKYYRLGDIVGQTGIEYTYEEFLRGTKGVKFVAVNRSGRKIASFDKGKSDIPVNNGFDLYLGIDKTLQEKGEELLKDKRGAIVALDPNNGEILAFVSKPDFNLLKFSGKISKEVYAEFDSDPAKPLFNRALQSQYPPGSTWKMLVALAALQEGIINENSTFSCPGSFTYGNRVYACHGAHGSVNVRKAIQASCNVFFYQVALKLGLENMGKYGTMFGFGNLTYIDIPNEGKGIMPTINWLDRRYGKGRYPKGNIVNYGIGQGEISVTPLQMAVYASVIANKGTYYQPHFVRSYYNNLTKSRNDFDYGERHLPINKKFFDIVQWGMYDCVNTPGGTATNAKLPGISICGKTGTAQNPHGGDHSWFVCFAPMDKPVIAMCVMVENAGFGAAVAAPIAQEMVKTYLMPDSTKSSPIIPTKVKKDTLNTITKLRN